MAVLTWDASGSRYYETGVDRGVLYIPDSSGLYSNGVSWNGLLSVTEKPTGAEANPMYADNIKYLNLYSVEQFGATIEAYTYPDEWAQFDGLIAPYTGVTVGQQAKKTFGLSYRTKLGNDTVGDDYGYKLHLIYGAVASPTERAYTSVNETPEPITFSWELTTNPLAVATIGANVFRPTALITIDSTKVQAAALTNLTNLLWGTAGGNPQLPAPDTVLGLFTGAATTSVVPTNPSFVAAGGTITITATTGVVYRRTDTNAIVSGSVVIGTPSTSLGISAEPLNNTYTIPAAADRYWYFTRTT
jgi:hypothetical protein